MNQDELLARISRLEHELKLHRSVQRQIDISHALEVQRITDAVIEGDKALALKKLRVLNLNLGGYTPKQHD